MARRPQEVVDFQYGRIYSLVANKISRQEIFRFCAQTFGIKQRQVENYITRANQELEEQARFNRAREFGRALHQLDTWIVALIKKSDYKGALAVRRELNSILGFHQETINLTIDWRARAVADIQTGIVSYDQLTEAFDESLAAELFRDAGVPVPDGASGAPALDAGNTLSGNGRKPA